MIKKVTAACLSIILCLSLLTILPACGKKELINKVPKTITVRNSTINGTYNPQTKTLTYQIGSGVDDPLEYICQALVLASTDTKINRDYADCEPVWGIIVNDAIRSGKIEKLKIIFDQDDIETFDFTRNKDHITRLFCKEFDAAIINYVYSKNGNIAQIKENGTTTTINVSNNQISSMTDRFYLDNGELLEAKTIVSYNKNGKVSSVKHFNSLNELMDSGPITLTNFKNCKYNSDGTISQFENVYTDADNIPIRNLVTYTYMTI